MPIEPNPRRTWLLISPNLKHPAAAVGGIAFASAGQKTTPPLWRRWDSYDGPMTAAETDAAREWLTRFIGAYAGLDVGESDPVHAVRAHAREMLVVGPTPDDPFTICKEMADALPHDQRAAGLCDTWREELDLARRRE